MSASGSRSYLTTPSRVQIQPSSPLDGEGGILCPGHKRRAAERTAGPHTKNPGRKFWVCPLPQGDQCKFFLWDDEVVKANSNAPATPQSIKRPVPAPKAVADPIDDDFDWGNVDTDALERDAIASTPSSSQQSFPTPTPFNNRLQALAEDSRKRKREDEGPRVENPFLSSQSVHPMLGDLSEHLHRQERLLAAAEKAKEGFRKTIKQRDDKIKEQEETIKLLRQRLQNA